MINGKRILAVVPARGGSKGIPLKNLRQVNGQSLVSLAGKITTATPEIDRAVVSTDHEGIAAAATAAGLDAHFRRPPDLSGDRIGDTEVLQHSLRASEAHYREVFDIVLMLQPTSPLRRVVDVQNTLKELVNSNWDAVWTVSETDSKSHPLKQLRFSGAGLDYYDPNGASIVARQQLDTLYHRNGVAYAITRDCLMNQNSIKGARTGAVVISGDHVSIDTEWDIALVELILSRRNDEANSA